MKKAALLLMMFAALGLSAKSWSQETVEVSAKDKEEVARELEREASSGKYDEKTSRHLQRVAEVFNDSKDGTEVEARNLNGDDCVNCQQSGKEKALGILKKIGLFLGKGAAWVSTTTARPFMTASGFVKGFLEKEEKNQDVLAFYQFFLNHQAEFDDLYLEAGTPEDMIELMLARMEEIMAKKSHIIMKDFLKHVGVDKEIPTDMSEFELTPEEIARIDMSKVDPAFINSHPEYQEVKPFIGEMTQQDLMDIVESGYFNKSISFENYKETLPKPAEMIGTIVGQIFAPKIALGIISKSLASLYVTPVVLADVGTGVSTAICLQGNIKAQFDSDKDLKSFCSYVVNRTGYQLMKSRAKGYVSGKKLKAKLNKKLEERRKRKAERKKQKEESQNNEGSQVSTGRELAASTVPQTEYDLERAKRRKLFYGK